MLSPFWTSVPVREEGDGQLEKDFFPFWGILFSGGTLGVLKEGRGEPAGTEGGRKRKWPALLPAA